MDKYVLKNIQVKYGKKIAVENFSINIKKDELLVILGPSGCGKSTLLSAIAGLIKPSKGEIKCGNSFVYSKEKKINIPVEKRKIGYVFQNYALWPHMTIFNNIAFPLKISGMKKSELRMRTNEILEIINLKDKEKSFPGEISGGEKQRAALGRAMACNPEILLLDEPMANLDRNLKEKLMKEIKEVQKKLNIPMIYVTHDQREAFEIADNIIIMNNGRIIKKGRAEEVYRKPEDYFVANFIGDNNIITNKNYIDNVIKIKSNRKINTIGIRPEDIVINVKGKHQGIITKCVFMGDCMKYTILDSTIELQVKSSAIEYAKLQKSVRYDILGYHEISNICNAVGERI